MAKKDPNKNQRICFRIRIPTGYPVQEFAMTINHIKKEYKLTDGQIYELPQYMIDYIHSFVIRETYTNVNGPDTNIVHQRFYCEPVNDDMEPR